MEVRKSPSKSRSTDSNLRSAVEFFGEVKNEIRKINWTEKDELQSYTKIVIGTTFLFGMGIYLVDLTIQGILVGLGSFVRLLTGF